MEPEGSLPCLQEPISTEGCRNNLTGHTPVRPIRRHYFGLIYFVSSSAVTY